jgi:PhoH-like ATPase
MSSHKMYILDTSVLVYDPESLFSFKGACVGIPIVVLEELDRFKGENTERGYHARQVIRHLDRLRKQGSLRDGVHLENGGTLKALFMPEDHLEGIPFDLELGDNAILVTAFSLLKAGYDVEFISKDLNARVKADVLGIPAEDFLKGAVTKERFYHGWMRLPVPAVSLKREFPTELDELVKEQELVINQFVLVESQHNAFNYKIFRYLGKGAFAVVGQPRLRWPLEARNPQQLMALNLLLDPDIELVSLIGPAGTGKTFLALLAGLHQVIIEEAFKKMLVSRPVIPLGADIGYLPGTVEEKLHSWMQPIYDNMELIMHAINLGQHFGEHDEGEFYGGKQGNKGKRRHRPARHIASLDDLIKEGKISLEAITYMRGRSIPYQYILIDEVQNLTPHEVKTLISRVGEGSKIILAGDPYQIDSPYLDFSSNGLMVASNKFKGQRLFGTVFLENSERSELSKLVSELL